MTSLTKDARFFVEGVTKHLRSTNAQSPLFSKVTAALHSITATARKEKTALVESVVGLNAKEKSEMNRFLSRLLARSVTLECKINKGLIGGIRVIAGDWIVDTSIATQISAMQEQLTQ